MAKAMCQMVEPEIGLGRALPRGEALFVPFNCDVVVGDPMYVTGKAAEFVKELTKTYQRLLEQCLTRNEDGS